MPLYQSPKSGKFIEIESDFDPVTGEDLARTEAMSPQKGWKPVHQLVSKSGKEIVVADDGLDEAIGKGWTLKGTGVARAQPGKSSAAGAALRGAAQGASFGFIDEASGAVGAAKELFTGNSNIKENYRTYRDSAREEDDAASDQNPLAFGAGALAGGLAAPGGALKSLGKLSSVPALAGAGALSGLGDSRADLTEGEFLEATGDAAIGAASGVIIPKAFEKAADVLPGAIRALPGAARQLPGMAREGKDAAVAAARTVRDAASSPVEAVRAMRSGAREAAKEADSLTVLGFDVAKLGARAQGAVQGLRETVDNAGEIAAVRSGKVLGGSEDALPLPVDLLDGGASNTKAWVAQRAATGAPGQIDGDEYRNLLEMGVDRRLDARAFDNKEVARTIAPKVDEAYDLFAKAKGDAFKALQTEASLKFKPEAGDPVIALIPVLRQESTKLKSIPGRTKTVLEDVDTLLVTGDAPSSFGLTKGLWLDVDGPERFTRLQRARELLQSEIEYNKAQNIDAGEKLLRGLENAVDRALKSVPEKVQADELFSRGAELEKRLFGVTEFRNGSGRSNVDEFKIARLFGDNDTAGRFRNAVSDTRDFLGSAGIDAETKTRMAGLLDEFDGINARAGDKRAIDSQRRAQGPSSPSIERLGYLLQRENLPESAIASPAGFLNSADQFVREFAEPTFGKPWKQLGTDEKTRLMKAFYWSQSNPKATQAQQQKALRSIFGGTQ